MVQIVDEGPSKISRFIERATPGLDKTLGRLLQRKEDVALEEKGYDVKGVRDPAARQLLLKEGQEAKKEQRKSLENLEEKRIIQKYFGPDYAELYSVLPTRAKDSFFEEAIDVTRRQGTIQDLMDRLQQKGLIDPTEGIEVEEAVEQTPQGEEIEVVEEIATKPEEYLERIKIPDTRNPPYGYTTEDWINEKKTWRKDNTPIYKDSKDKLRNVKRDLLGTRKLQKLNETKKVGEGFERLLINPLTGDFYGLAQLAQVVSPEAQEWVKEIARFGNRAKDAYGSRITDFDLRQYMKQFPSLLNTQEGRRRIIEMMEINYSMDEAYNEALKSIYEKAKLNQISPEDAEMLAEEAIAPLIKKLEDKYLKLDAANMEQVSQEGKANRPSLEEIFS